MYTFKIEDREISLNMSEGVFVPTGTTKVLAEGIRDYVHRPGKLLDLGCGSGAVGITLQQMGLVESPLYASDISEQAVECVRKNAVLNNCPVVARSGSLFAPWANEKFDYIVDDVAGIAQEVAWISPWYDKVPCESGVDGTSLVREIVKEAPGYLNPGGLFFFPVISFSNIEVILATARDYFSQVKQLSHTEWPLPKEMYAQLDTLKKLQAQGHIEFIEKFGMILYFTDVYVAYQ